MRLLQAFSTQVHQSAPSLHDDCFRGSGAGCSSTAFPILIAANAIWETLRSTERQIKKIELIFEYLVACGLRHPSKRTQTTICALLTRICISWVPGLILDFSGGICKVWLQTRMCLDAISQKIKQTHMCLVTRSNVRVCV